MVCVEIVDAHVIGFINGCKPCRLTRFHQIFGHLCLPINHHLLASSQTRQVDAMPLTLEQQIKARVDQSFLIQALVDAGLRQNI